MRIDHLEVENFKNYESLVVDFSPGVNLLVGGNGSGKTSLLEAINVAVGGFFGAQEQKMQRMIDIDEIRLTMGKRAPQATVRASSVEPSLSWSRSIKRDSKNNDTRGIRAASEYGKSIIDTFDKENDRTIAPLIAYYSTQRLFKDSYLSGRQKYDAAAGRRNGYLQSLKENAIKGTLNEWLGNAVTRRATLQIKEIDKPDLVLENVEQAVRKTLILFLDLSKDFTLKIYQDPDFNFELFINYDDEHDMPLSYYSDGFRNLVYLIVDMVWRGSQLNPWLGLDELADKINGIVTIDEIDLHLHPKWQAKAIGLIQHLFPNVQFFVTTHSPTVVANFELGSLYVISQNQIRRHAGNFFGKEINTVLRDILGAPDRHVPTQNKINLLLQKIEENGDEAEAQGLLNELIELLGHDDADIQRAESIIEWNNIKDDQ